VARLLILLTFPFDCGPDSASRGALGKHGCRLMPSRRPADPVRIRASRARAPEVPSDRKSHRRPSLIHGGHIERQATRPARGALAIARPTFASDLTCGLAGGQNCIVPMVLEDRPRRFRVGILRAPKTWTLKKLGAALVSRVAVLLEFVLAVTAASMPIVTLGINGQGRTYLTGRARLPDDHLHGEDLDANQIGRHCAGVVARAKPGVVWRRLAGRIDLPATQRSEADQNSLQPLAHK
jgi:hypothetical protein